MPLLARAISRYAARMPLLNFVQNLRGLGWQLTTGYILGIVLSVYMYKLKKREPTLDESEREAMWRRADPIIWTLILVMAFMIMLEARELWPELFRAAPPRPCVDCA